MIDTMIHDGLWSTFTEQHMGESSDDVNAELGISRDGAGRVGGAFASAGRRRLGLRARSPRRSCRSRSRSAAATRSSSNATRASARTRSPRRSRRLAPAFHEDGTITAGNASQISDGAAAVVVASAEKAEQLGLEPLVEIVAHGMSAERFPYLHTVPAIALQHALKKAQLDVHDLGLLEVNEAFAAVALNVDVACSGSTRSS